MIHKFSNSNSNNLLYQQPRHFQTTYIEIRVFFGILLTINNTYGVAINELAADVLAFCVTNLCSHDEFIEHD